MKFIKLLALLLVAFNICAETRHYTGSDGPYYSPNGTYIGKVWGGPAVPGYQRAYAPTYIYRPTYAPSTPSCPPCYDTNHSDEYKSKYEININTGKE
jgi:hypothetical protein